MKDIYNGKVKKDFIGYVTYSLVLFCVVCIVLAFVLLLVALLYEKVDSGVLILLYVMSGLSFLMSTAYPALTIHFIRSYPKHPKITKSLIKGFVLNDFIDK